MSDFDYIVETFDFLVEWDARYQFLEELGSRLTDISPENKVEDNLVHGCASNVWIIGQMDESGSGKFIYQAEAEQPIIRGLVYLILQIFAGKTPDEVLNTSFDESLKRLGLDEHLSTQRHIGMYALVQKMRSLALPFAKQDSFEIT